MHIRAATIADLPGILEIEEVSFATPWSREILERELQRMGGPQEGYTAVYLVAHEADRVLGYAGMWLCWGEAHILTLAVDPGLRRRGLGQALLDAALRHVAEDGCHYATLEYRASNEAAAALYAKFGFEVAGRRKGYYHETGEDAIIADLHDLQSQRVLDGLAALRREWEGKHG
jgi:ribosomal-protein-alanine N-acetyltransferase